MKNILLLISLGLSSCASQPPPIGGWGHPPTVFPNGPIDHGGIIGKYALRVLDHNEEVDSELAKHLHPVTPITGICWSACTLKLAETDACVAPDASFAFHKPFLPNEMFADNKTMDVGGTQMTPQNLFLILFKLYRPAAAKILQKDGFVNSYRLVYRNGIQIHKLLNIPLCPKF